VRLCGSVMAFEIPILTLVDCGSPGTAQELRWCESNTAQNCCPLICEATVRVDDQLSPAKAYGGCLIDVMASKAPCGPTLTICGAHSRDAVNGANGARQELHPPCRSE